MEKVIRGDQDVAGPKRTKFIGRWKTKLSLLASGAANNLLRLSNLGVA